MIKNILFDLDGTLIYSAEDIIHCLKKAYQAVGIPCAIKDTRTIVGPPLKHVIHTITPNITDETVATIITNFKNMYDTSSYPTTLFVAGAKELLRRAYEKKIKMFVVTNKRLVPTKRILEKLYSVEYFDDIVTSDSHEGVQHKRDMINYIIVQHKLELQNTVMVGDAESDIVAAHANGIASIAYMRGYGDATLLRNAQPSYSVNELNEVCDMIQKGGI